MNQKIPVFAVVRVDEDLSPDNAITIKEILPTAEEAIQEVERLNKLQSGKKCHYFWQYTRYYPNGRTKDAAESSSETED